MTDISTGISLIKDLINFVIQRKSKNNLRFNKHIDDLFQKAKAIVDDYNKILIELETQFLKSNMTIDEVIIYCLYSGVKTLALRRNL